MRRPLLLLLLLLLLPAGRARAEEDSLGEKVKKIFTTPTPTPERRHRTHTTKKKSTPTPSPSPTPKRKKKKSPTPSPTATETPIPSPSETPTATPPETPSPSPTASPEKESTVATISPDEIKGYEDIPPPIRKLLETGLALTNRNLKYTYGSADPETGGMDCSGFIYYVLRENGVKDVPRDASGQYVWVRKAGNFRAVLSRDLDSFELEELKAGDLLFWTGTYDVEKDPPVTHTMIYLGKNKETGKQVMLGASDGRSFEGKQMFGVSVFDFKTSGAKEDTSSGRHPRFVGYGRIPGLP
ncbi:MAG: C40 family peptidase [Chthoniobacterales bacterium]|nr:C40 family peptidase [Chthoniobacterales bacterium]